MPKYSVDSNSNSNSNNSCELCGTQAGSLTPRRIEQAVLMVCGSCETAGEQVENGPQQDVLSRGTVVLAPDPYEKYNGRRPFLIISGENYPFYPNGYLGIPLTRENKKNTFEITQSRKERVYEPFEKDDNYVNPWNPKQINDWDRTLCVLSEPFVDKMAVYTGKAVGL